MANNDFHFHELYDNNKEKMFERELKNFNKKNTEYTFIDFVNTNKKICQNIGKIFK